MYCSMTDLQSGLNYIIIIIIIIISGSSSISLNGS